MKIALRTLAVLLIGMLLSGCIVKGKDTTVAAGAAGAGGNVWDAGNIISDEVFYNNLALPNVAAVQSALDLVGSACTATTCLRLNTYTTGTVTSQWCDPYTGAPEEKFAAILFKLAQSCKINPQVIIILIQKESQGLTRTTPPSALTGVGCPDTGPNGSANCDSGVGGVWNQTFGAFQAFAKLHKDASKVNYPEGKTTNILWNVAETGCGSAPVAVANRATATLYTFTPYQPNAASLAAYPGEGDKCSAYGNRNFFEMFKKYFGPTGGGKAGTSAGGDTVVANGVQIQIPSNDFVVAALRGKVITAPTAGLATGIAAGFSKLGMPYVWGGGGSGADADNGCSRGGGDKNSCGSEIGFDCSGLTAYVLGKAGFMGIPGNSGDQRNGGTDISWDAGLPGDIIGFSGHVAVNLGVIDGKQYILEASDVGIPIHIVELRRTDHDAQMHRYWTSAVA